MIPWEIADRADLAHAKVVTMYRDDQLVKLGTSLHEVHLMRDRATSDTISEATRITMTRYLEGLSRGTPIPTIQKQINEFIQGGAA